MTQLRTSKQTDLAFNYFQKLKGLLKDQRVLFLETGMVLKILRDEKLYRSLGDDYFSWTQFLGDPDIGIKQSTAYAYISIYEVFVLKYGISMDVLAEIPYDKLRQVLPSVRKAQNADEVHELVAKAKSLSRSDLLLETENNAEEIEGEIVKTKLVKLAFCSKCEKYRLLNMTFDELCTC